MTFPTPRLRAKQLRTVLRQAAHAYHELNEPMMTDLKYDFLFRELVDLERTYPDLATPDSPTQRVGVTPAAHHQTVQHRFPMLSLTAACSIGEVRDWYKRMRAIAGHDPVIVGELKIDGVSLSLTYERGDLVRAVTRGDGHTGVDVTAHALAIATIPKRLKMENPPEWVEVRGEAIINKLGFDILNANLPEPYASPRHACAATLQLADAAQSALRGVVFCAYSLHTSGDALMNHYSSLTRLYDIGFFVHPSRKSLTNLAEIKQFIQTLNSARQDLSVPTDGLVLKVNDRSLQEQIGASPVAPHWALAVKIQSDEAPALVTRMEGGSAHFDAIPLAGAVVDCATVAPGLDVSAGDTVVVRGAAGEDPVVVQVLGFL